MKKVLLTLALGLVLSTSFISCRADELNENYIEDATDKDCVPGSGDKCDK